MKLTLSNILSTSKAFAFAAILGSTAFAIQAFAAETNDAQTSAVEHDFFDSAALDKNAKLSEFKTLYIEMPSVMFSERWLKDRRNWDLTDSYKEQIKTRYSKVLKKSLAKALKKTHFTLVESAEGADLVLQSGLDSLKINAPDHDILVKKYVARAGNATFKMTLVAPESGNILAKISDNRDTRERGFTHLKKTSKVQNQRDFRLLMERWSKHAAAFVSDKT